MALKTGFLWILLAGVIYGAIHSAFASKTVKEWMITQFGLENPNVYRFFFSLQSFFFTLVYVLLIFFLPDSTLYMIPFPWVFFTTFVEVTAVVFAVICMFQTGPLSFFGLSAIIKHQTKPEELKTDGFYGVMRHPLYVFSMLMIWLLPIMTWNILAFNIGASLYMLVGAYVEERKLTRDFGEKYLEYKKLVPPFWPKLSH